MIHTDCHTFDPIFSPPYISPKPLFLPKIVTQSPIFVTLSRIFEIFHSKTPNELEFEKKVPKCCLFFMAFVTERPPIFLPCMLLPQTRSEAGKFCNLERESSNLVNTFRCKFNKGDENKISVLQAQPTQLCIIRMNFIEGRDDIQAIIHLVKHGRGYILQTPSINLHPWLS